MRHRTITQGFLTPLSKIFERIMFVYNAHLFTILPAVWTL